ncbi:conserved hypothetical protein [Paraburkholderia ribeironis]|uniref:DUF6429 domain-containing protein n=1 Tax=Paraburkholderia ribeironis TaxID=1247936 RepID=A0A1N7SC87_9BURK|nr:DUF6429 family protein [Paraburkholderia ribeironis]SIT44944.1 conserved hypothetical protein [Paraburkholderia ribeironis]
MNIDTEAIDEVVLALLHLNLCERNRAWKGFDWPTMNRLHEKGFIHDPVSRARSVGLTNEGLREAERLFTKYFVRAADLPPVPPEGKPA